LEKKLKPICFCVKCGQILDRATRDNPCPNCGSSFFTVKYVGDLEKFLPPALS
jgi:RNA polymerase subunit RPABC4/transcription elongation factor Spt4